MGGVRGNSCFLIIVTCLIVLECVIVKISYLFVLSIVNVNILFRTHSWP